MNYIIISDLAPEQTPKMLFDNLIDSSRFISSRLF